MPRLLAILALLAIVEPSIGAIDVCQATCPDDGPDGTCPPACCSCICCAHAARPVTAGAAASVTAPPPARTRSFLDAEISPPSPEPRDIFHVPKRARA